uniref:Uncharacterized protein n=1 Tax=viral metagenome TaxID=1070528 RepID=A0A6M3IGV0_9ZZZZ
MSYPFSTAQVLLALGFELDSDFECTSSDSGTRLKWKSQTTQPTEQQISDYAADVTSLPGGQLFSIWLAEHGGDTTLTARRIAKEYIDQADDANYALTRALGLVVLDEINTLRGQHSLAPRTKAQLKAAIKAKIDSGEADD